MIYILEFTFQSGWHFAGMFLFVFMGLVSIEAIVKTICQTRLAYFEHKEKERKDFQERMKGARMGRLGPLNDEPFLQTDKQDSK